MRIVELTDYSMVISDSSYDINKMGEIFFNSGDNPEVKVFIHGNLDSFIKAESHLLTPNLFILYFNDSIPPCFHVGDTVGLKVGRNWYEKNYENSRNR